jgi:hypothetical protein
MTTPSGGDEPADQAPRPTPSPAARRVRRHPGRDEPAGRWATPDSERDGVWGDAAPDSSEQLRRDVPPHHGG